MMIHIHKRIHQQQQHMYGTGCLILNPISFSFYLVHLWFIVLGIFFFSFLILLPLSFTTITEWVVCCVVSLVYDDPFNFYDDRCWKEDWDRKIYFGWIRNAFQFIWIQLRFYDDDNGGGFQYVGKSVNCCDTLWRLKKSF